MKSPNAKARCGPYVLYLALCTFFVILSACGSGNSSSDADDSSSRTGSIAFRLVLQDTSSQRSVVPAQAPDICTLGVSEVEASVLTADDAELRSGGPWGCTLHRGEITEVPAQSNLKLRVQGKGIYGTIIYEGEKTGITVRPGKKAEEEVSITRKGSNLWDEMVWDQDKWG